jgi:hypothetical protein
MITLSNTRPPVFVPWDIDVARINFGANCGPSSFAAITGREVCRIMRYFLHFERCQWTNLTQMRHAFSEAGYVTNVRKCELPVRGVALMQWLGPWTKKKFFSHWSLIHTHWIAVHNGWVFDHTAGQWQSFREWQRQTATKYISEIPQATGWAVKYGVDVSQSSSAWFGF